MERRIRAAEVRGGCHWSIVADDHEGLFNPTARRGIKHPPVDVDRGFQPVIPPTQVHGDRAAQGVSDDANTIEVEPATEPAVGSTRSSASNGINDLRRRLGHSLDFLMGDVDVCVRTQPATKNRCLSPGIASRSIHACACRIVIPDRHNDEATAGQILHEYGVLPRRAVPRGHDTTTGYRMRSDESAAFSVALVRTQRAAESKAAPDGR